MVFFACSGTLCAFTETGTHSNDALEKLYAQLASKQHEVNALRQERSTCEVVANMPDVSPEDKAKAALVLQKFPEQLTIKEAEMNSIQSEINRQLKTRTEDVLKNGGDASKISDIIDLYDAQGNPSEYELHLANTDAPQAAGEAQN